MSPTLDTAIALEAPARPTISEALGITGQEDLAEARKLIQKAQDSLPSKQRDEILAELHEQYSTIKSGFEWALSRKDTIEAAAEIASTLSVFCFFKDLYSEGLKWCEDVLAKAPESSKAQAMALAGAGLLYRAEGRLVKARKHFEESVQILRGEVESAKDPVKDRKMMLYYAFALAFLGLTERDLAESSSALKHIRQSLDLFKKMRFQWGIALTQQYLGMAALSAAREAREASGKNRNKEEIKKWIEQAVIELTTGLELFQKIGDQWGITGSLIYLGFAAYHRAHYEESEGRDVEASLYYEEARQKFKEYLLQLEVTDDEKIIENKRGIARCLCGLAAVANNQGDAYMAVKLLGAAESLRLKLDPYQQGPDARVHYMPVLDDITDYVQTCESARKSLGSNLKQKAFEEGKSMKLAKVITYATQGVIVVDDFNLLFDPKNKTGPHMELTEYLERFRSEIARIPEIRAVALAVVGREANSTLSLSIYAVGDFRWMSRKEAMSEEAIQHGHETYSSVKRAYSTFDEDVRASTLNIPYSLWFFDTKGEDIAEVIPTLRDKLVGDEPFGFSSDDQIIGRPYVSVLR